MPVLGGKTLPPPLTTTIKTQSLYFLRLIPKMGLPRASAIWSDDSPAVTMSANFCSSSSLQCLPSIPLHLSPDHHPQDGAHQAVDGVEDGFIEAA